MKKLYLIRHAKSSWKDLTQGDFERPLNARGKLNAPFMGKQLQARGEEIDHFISSPAKRAISTARMVTNELGKDNIQEEPRIYHASVTTLLNVINGLNNEWNSVALFGHNPGLTNLTEYLSGTDIHNMPTTGMVRIDFDSDDWALVSRQSGSLIWFDYPKRYPEMQ
jgi:phosphohistidine phosphatase